MAAEDFLAASDTARMQSGGKSIFDKVYDAATAGTAGAVVSGLTSLYNTGVKASRKLPRKVAPSLIVSTPRN
jgi:hypothetical protein